ncbi:MAG TPA: hypothetical protein VGD71_14645 [Kribbella sp.]
MGFPDRHRRRRCARPDRQPAGANYDVTLAERSTIDRVALYTLDSIKYPAATNGLRDWDVQVQTGGARQTVRSTAAESSATRRSFLSVATA